jgi:hypothetical protein
MAGDDDFPGRGSSPVDGWPPDFDHLVIPDDARELDADARALARERRARARRERLHNLTRVRHWHGYSLSWAIAIAVVAATVGVTTSLLLALRPSSRIAPRSQPLATAANHPVGTEGGLLPDVTIGQAGNVTSALRVLRPAVIVLIPDGRDVTDMIRAAVRVADRHHVYAVAIGSRLPDLPADLRNTSLVSASDPDRTLLTTFRVGNVPVLLLVRSNGVLSRILTGIQVDSTLDAEVVSLAT